MGKKKELKWKKKFKIEDLKSECEKAKKANSRKEKEMKKLARSDHKKIAKLKSRDTEAEGCDRSSRENDTQSQGGNKKFRRKGKLIIGLKMEQ